MKIKTEERLEIFDMILSAIYSCIRTCPSCRHDTLVFPSFYIVDSMGLKGYDFFQCLSCGKHYRKKKIAEEEWEEVD